MSDRQRALTEAIAARERVEALVAELGQAREECEQQLKKANREDAVKMVTGRSSIERAIEEAQRMVAVLDRQIAECRRELAKEGELGGGGEMGNLAAAIHVSASPLRAFRGSGEVRGRIAG